MNFVGGEVWFEIFHYLGIAFWLGSIAMLDFRLMGFSSKVPVRAFHLSAAAYTGFGLTLITGLFMYSNAIEGYNSNNVFKFKMVLLLVAIVFGFLVQMRHAVGSDSWQDGKPPITARLAGFVSLLLWFGVLAAGRMITYFGYTQG